jgi:hypothetical protein
VVSVEAVPAMHLSWKGLLEVRFERAPKELSHEKPEKSKPPYELKEDPAARELQSKPLTCWLLHLLLVLEGQENGAASEKPAETRRAVEAKATRVESVDLIFRFLYRIWKIVFADQ